MTNPRYRLIPGLGIEDTETEDIYITMLEITGLLNRLNHQIEVMKKDEHQRTTKN